MVLLSKSNKQTLHAIVASFGAYFCMYAFRKPFTVATFDGISFLSIDYKILLIIAQLLGYMLSKFLGIKIISELTPTHRARYFVCFIVLAELFLCFFAVTPAPYNIVFMFLNGLPLGMVWGIVFSYLEGRKTTEVLGVFLCSSFIVSSGVVKSIGRFVSTTWHFSDFWMPSITGLLFLVPMLLFIFMLEKIPQPTKADIALKNPRVALTALERKKLLQKLGPGLIVLVFFFMFLTSFRDFRDNFARELWDALGYQNSTSIYTTAELPIAIVVLAVLGVIGRIKDNTRAFAIYHYVILGAAFCIGISTWLFQIQLLSALYWMIITGFGLYTCYVPFNCIFFDRMIAALKLKANAGFLIYIADSFGYLASVAVLLYKNFGQSRLSFISFFIYGTYAISILGVLSMGFSLFYFRYRIRKKSIYKKSIKLGVYES